MLFDRARPEPPGEIAARNRHRIVTLPGRRIHLVGVISGLQPEAERVRALAARIEPRAVALGLPPENVEALRAILREELAGEEYEMSEEEELYAFGLRRFGNLALPPAELLAAVEWADASGVPVVAVDLSEEAYTDRFVQVVGTLDLLRHGSRMRKAAKRLMRAKTVEAYCLGWDEAVLRSRGMRQVELAREEAMARGLADIPGDAEPVLAIVDLARVEGIARNLGGEGFSL